MPIISRGDVAELLEFIDASLDEIALFVFAFAERDFFDPVRFRRNDRCAVLILDQISDPVGIVAPVCEEAGAFGQVLQKKFGHWCIMGMAG